MCADRNRCAVYWNSTYITDAVAHLCAAPGHRRLDRGYVVLKDEVVGWLFEPQPGQPAPVHLRPGWPVVVVPVPQQEAGELLAGLAQGAYRRLTRPHQIGACQTSCRAWFVTRSPIL